MGFLADLFGKLITKLPWLASPWVKVTLYAAAVSFLFWTGWHAHTIVYNADQAKAYEQQLKAQKEQADEQHKKDLQQHQTDEAAIKTSALAKEALETEVQKLREAAQGKPLTQEVPEKSDVPNSPVHVSRNSTFRLCYNAAQTGAASDIAACKASGVPVKM